MKSEPEAEEGLDPLLVAYDEALARGRAHARLTLIQEGLEAADVAEETSRTAVDRFFAAMETDDPLLADDRIPLVD